MKSAGSLLQVQLKAASQGSAVVVDLLVTLDDANEQSLAMRHCSPHRTCALAIPGSRLPEWRQRQAAGDHAGCSDLLQPAVVLWDQPCWSACSDEVVRWRQTLPDGLITRSLLERLRWCEQLSELILCLQMLLLEAELNDQPQVGSDDLCESLFEIDHGSSKVLWQELVQLEHGLADLADSDEVALY